MYSVWLKFSLSFTNYYINMDVVYFETKQFYHGNGSIYILTYIMEVKNNKILFITQEIGFTLLFWNLTVLLTSANF